MTSAICERLEIEFPLFAFSHCRDVVAAVSRAGGMGVFGAVNLGPEQLEEELAWIDTHVDGKPYGVDLIVPNKIAGLDGPMDADRLVASLPAAQTGFVDKILTSHDISTEGLTAVRKGNVRFADNMRSSGAEQSLRVALNHPVKLIANALGVPPPIMLELGRTHGVAVAALVGSTMHAKAQIEAGVDILVAAGGEAGGHCGEVSTMVLVPEVVRTVADMGSDIPVLAAGGIVTGAQMAAAMAMGAAGAWTGSVWLTTAEAETSPVVKAKMLAATSKDTIRSRSRTGKPSRQLKSAWTQAWEGPGAPAPLPMPLQSLVAEPALAQVDKLAAGGHEGAKALATYWVGQGVGLMNQEASAVAIVQQFKQDFLGAYERLQNFLG